MKLFALTLLVYGVSALTDEEAKHFQNSHQYGGSVSTRDNGNTITLTSNGIPDHRIEMVNPNTPVAMSDVYEVPKEPTVTDKPGCLSMGAIGMTITGSLIFDPLDAQGENAVEGSGAEKFDSFGGHTAPGGQYHYHKMPGQFMYNGETDKLLGVAFDGFPIYGPMASDLGRDVTNSDLDQCHGRFVNGQYRYHFNTEFPYILGCYRGSTVNKAPTVYGSCTNTSTLPEYGYVCACARGPNGGQHQPMNHQQGGQYQPMNHQQGGQGGQYQPMNQQQGGQPINQQGGQYQPMNQQQGGQEGGQYQPMNQQQGGQEGGQHQPMNQQGGQFMGRPLDPMHHQGYPFGPRPNGLHHLPPPNGPLFGKK